MHLQEKVVSRRFGTSTSDAKLLKLVRLTRDTTIIADDSQIVVKYQQGNAEKKASFDNFLEALNLYRLENSVGISNLTMRVCWPLKLADTASRQVLLVLSCRLPQPGLCALPAATPRARVARVNGTGPWNRSPAR